jgi:fructose-bisphosphate aldolase class II
VVVTLASTAGLIADAVARQEAVPSFNVICLEHAEGIVLGAERAGTGVLLQLSENAVRFHGGSPRPVLAACRELAAGATVPIAVHFDHIEDPVLAGELIGLGSAAGIGSLMFDASRHDYARNVAATAATTARGHAAGIWMEAELGEVGGKDGAHAPGVRTDPGEAAAFVAATGVDGLAVAVGSSHAMTTRSASLDIGLIAQLAQAVPVPLVLHGSSGVPDDVIREAVAAGIRKVNVGTALNIAYTGAVRAFLAADDVTTDPRTYLTGAREAIAKAVASFCAVIAG